MSTTVYYTKGGECFPLETTELLFEYYWHAMYLISQSPELYTIYVPL